MPQPRKAHVTKLTRASYLYIPTAFVYCRNDEANPLFVQELVVEAVRTVGADIHEYTCDAGHSPHLSQPQVLTNLMLEFVSKVDGKQ